MLAVITSYAPLGIEGQIISVEIDIRRGLPGIDIVGLPDSAVKEAKERVRVAIKNSGFYFPVQRILINLAPAAIKKEGACFDLPIALGILIASEQISTHKKNGVLILGELNLSGMVRPIHGVLSAVGTGLEHNFKTFLVPLKNLQEALALGRGNIFGIENLRHAASILCNNNRGFNKPNRSCPNINQTQSIYNPEKLGDFSDIKGHCVLKRALEIAAAGRHHVLLFGPPGSGKTMAAHRLPTILPFLTKQESLEVTRIHSVAGLLPQETGLIACAPFRMPHHTASNQGIIGGGKNLKPGEVSLAHRGILFLDEAPEFKRSLLQSLREPIEQDQVTIVRAGQNLLFPSALQLIMAANPCPCGNLGRSEHVCMCSINEIRRYWRKMGGALLDRIDIRVPVKPVTSELLLSNNSESSKTIKERVVKAINIQKQRYRNHSFQRNSRISPGIIMEFCKIDQASTEILTKVFNKLCLSSRAYHSILRIARTIADIEGSESIIKNHILEAIQHRRYGEEDTFWSYG